MAGTTITIDVRRLKRSLGSASRQLNERQILHAIGNSFLEFTDEQFQTEGRRGGRRWRPLKLATIVARTRIHKWPGRKLQVSGSLKKSVVSVVKGDTVEVGSNLKYAGVMNDGRGPIPARPFLPTVRQGQRLADETVEASIQLVLRRAGLL